jgi:hypothetical protein
MRRYIFLILIIIIAVPVYSQISHGGKPKSFTLEGLKANIDYRIMPEIDVEALLIEDAEDELKGNIPWRFGKDLEVDLNLNNSGSWETLDNGDRIWRLEITSYGAFSINLIYDQFYLPEGATFFVYNEQKTHLIGSFTHLNNKPGGTFASVPVRGETCILEYYEPNSVHGEGQVSVSHVIHAYKNVFNIAEKGFGSSGACNVNVNCPEGDDWRDQQRGVAMILNGNNNRICSGSMINNTLEDGRPYFLTANHCGSGVADTWIIMFNYESPACENVDGPTDQSIQYTTVRATSYVSDLLLLELSEVPPIEYNVFYNGWDKRDIENIGSTAIHHPRGDIKKISFDYDTTASDKYLGTQGIDGAHWKITLWDLGTTEGGSSGSPLFNSQKQIIGQLHGGWASCTVLEPDWYGKFSYSWDYFDEPEKQLKHWLDPIDSGVEFLDGYDAGAVQFDYNASLSAIIEPQDQYTEQAIFNPKVVISNKGTLNLNTLNVSYQLDNGEIISQEWSGDLAENDTAHIIFPETNLTYGTYELKAFTDSPNGMVDQYLVNDTLTKVTEVVVGYDLAITEFFSPSGVNCDLDDLKLEFMVKNEGSQIIYGFNYSVIIDGNLIAEEENAEFLDPDEEKYVFYNLQIDDTEWHNLEVIVGIDDNEDQNPENNSYSSDFNAYGNRFEFVLVTDNAASETSWVLVNSMSGPVASETEFSNNYKYKYSFCLEAGCYALALYDEGGNGIDLTLGSFSLVNLNSGNTYLESIEFIDELVVEFCISDNIISDFTIDPSDHCMNSDIRFYNLSVNADAYEWYFEGGTPETSTDASPLIQYAETGTYDVELTAYSGEDSNIRVKENYITVVNCSGLEEVENDLFSIFPNPTQGHITIELKDEFRSNELILYNALGAIVFQKTLNGQSTQTINLNLATGIYTIELRSDDKSEKRMLLIN